MSLLFIAWMKGLKSPVVCCYPALCCGFYACQTGDMSRSRWMILGSTSRM